MWGRHVLLAVSHSCINGSSAIQVLSIEESEYSSYIFAQIYQLLNSKDYKATVNMD